MDTPATREAERSAPDTSYERLQAREEFQTLRRRYRNFAFPMTIAFLTWYLLYVLCSNYASGFMGIKLVGSINVAFGFGLLQFVSTFLIAWLYSRHADNNLDPLAEGVRSRFEEEAR